MGKHQPSPRRPAGEEQEPWGGGAGTPVGISGARGGFGGGQTSPHHPATRLWGSLLLQILSAKTGKNILLAHSLAHVGTACLHSPVWENTEKGRVTVQNILQAEQPLKR